MKDCYTGDIGDFGKLGLLRAMRNTGLTIGVNWYRTPGRDNNDDGCYIQYLSDKQNEARYICCDEQLYRELQRIDLLNNRRVSALEKESILDAEFYSAALDFTGSKKTMRREIRKGWHGKALDTLNGCDIVFADPDNGLLVPSAAGKPKENKYVLPEELADYYAAGSSVIYYQHKARRPDAFYLQQHRNLLDSVMFEKATGSGIKFRTTSQRYYFFIVRPEHSRAFYEGLTSFMKSPWNGHFELLEYRIKESCI